MRFATDGNFFGFFEPGRPGVESIWPARSEDEPRAFETYHEVRTMPIVVLAEALNRPLQALLSWSSVVNFRIIEFRALVNRVLRGSALSNCPS